MSVRETSTHLLAVRIGVGNLVGSTEDDHVQSACPFYKHITSLDLFLNHSIEFNLYVWE